MNTKFNKFAAFTAVLILSTASLAQTAPPPAPVRNATDDYHGMHIVDPYRLDGKPSNPGVCSVFESAS